MKLNNIMRIKAVALIYCFILIMSFVTGCSNFKLNASAKNQVKEVSNKIAFSEVKKGDISMTVQGSGLLTPARAVNIYFKDLSGPLKKVNVMLGDDVKAGQVIFELDVKDVVDEIKDKELELRLQELKNKQNDQTIAINTANVEQAQKDLELAEKANNIEPTVITKNAIEKARTEYERAKNNLKNSTIGKEMGEVQVSLAKAELEKLKEKLKQGNLTSPIAGKVVFMERVFETENVTSGKVLARIAEPSDIVFQMLTSEAKNIQGEIEATLTIGTEKHQVQLYTPKPGDLLEQSEKDPKTKNKVYFSFKDSSPKLGMNDTVQASLELKKKGTLLLPKSVVRDDSGKRTVDISKNGSIEAIEILTGLENDEMVEVISGLDEGAQVLTK